MNTEYNMHGFHHPFDFLDFQIPFLCLKERVTTDDCLKSQLQNYILIDIYSSSSFASTRIVATKELGLTTVCILIHTIFLFNFFEIEKRKHLIISSEYSLNTVLSFMISELMTH